MIRGYANTSPEFQQALQAMATANGWDAQALANVISVETNGTFSPSIRNPNSDAVGLIQFMPSTARELGTTTEALARMTAVQQLEYVQLYLRRILAGRKPQRRVDYYLAVFYPAAIGVGMDTPFLRAPSPAYKANRNAFDSEGKGYITPRDLDYALASFAGEAPQKKKTQAGQGSGDSSC